MIGEILKSIEYKTKKEESFVNVLFEKFEIERKLTLKGTISDIVKKLEQNKFTIENFVGEIFNYFSPFSNMIEDIYYFLNNYSVTIDSRATQFRFNFEKFQEKITFDISNFPIELIKSFSKSTVSRLINIYDINLSAQGNYGSKNSNVKALSFISGYDGDFYNRFITPISYFWSIKNKADSTTFSDFSYFESLINPLFDDIEFLLNSVFDFYNLSPVEKKMPFWGKLSGKIIEYSENERYIVLKKGFEIDSKEPEVRYDENYNLENELNCLALALQFWKNKYVRIDYDRHNWTIDNQSVHEFIKNPKIYFDFVTKQLNSYTLALSDIIILKGQKSMDIIIEDLLKFVRLPYWKNRWHIYELWSMFFCLNIIKDSYSIKLNIIQHSDHAELVIPKAIAKEPIAKIINNDRVIECWFQRKTINNITGEGLEPDLRFMKNTSFPEDLFILENKDRKNCSGTHVSSVRNKYFNGTNANSIWIVNYENYAKKEYSKLFNENFEERSVWIASNFKPNNVPSEFYKDFLTIIKEYLEPNEQKVHISYDLLIDKSGSMESKNIYPMIEDLYKTFNYFPNEIFTYDSILTKISSNNISELVLSKPIKFNGDTNLLNCFENYLREKEVLPTLIYIISDGDGLYECFEKYNSEILKKQSILNIIKII